MSKVLYLHVGMPKCATTTLQTYLLKNALRLRENGVFYERHPEDKTQNQGNAAHIASHLLNNQIDTAGTLLEYFFRQEGKVILSSEMFIAAARGDAAGKFVARVEALGFAVHVICYLRRQDFWIESDYKQHVKGQSPWVGNIQSLLARRLQIRTLDYHWMVDNWAKVVGKQNIHVIPLNPTQSRNHAIESFLSILGVDLKVDDQSDDRNVSPPTGLSNPLGSSKEKCFVSDWISMLPLKRLRRFFS